MVSFADGGVTVDRHWRAAARAGQAGASLQLYSSCIAGAEHSEKVDRKHAVDI